VSKKIIKCSQCDATFERGFEYRMHWEKYHYNDAIRFYEELKKRNESL
tara:strand:- start:518 stop:661 length:144 start_codon:yes stop_codon:yes gene_type:complete